MSDWRPTCDVGTLRERARLLARTRAFFAARDVIEVQTPVAGQRTVTDPAIASVAAAHDRHLQTSPEYHMKRLLAAGAPSIYQIGPAFRRGEAGRWHNPEFTMIEWYRIGFDTEALMTEVAALVDALIGPARYQRHTCDDLVQRRFGVGLTDEQAVLEFARGLGLADARLDEAFDLILADALQSRPAERIFVTDFPLPLAALARLGDNGMAARFELVVDGVEVANGYHELTDADELAARMADDARKRRERGLPAVVPDDRLLAAQHHGLPECSGVAVGFDRLLALKLGADSIAEVMAFDWGRA